ncbi:MAG TPA: class GN sortase [Thermoanaerobaculia bacterium]|nr:class GN sortase [Thermoanaerobaculia bacterium]
MNSRGPRLARLALALVAASGVALVARGAWVPAKATLAQGLLAAAWERAVAGEARPRPWPSADTWPVARLHLPGRPPLVVLAGASGRTLAFGPGRVEGTAAPGEPGNLVVAGHRDTHFRALADVVPGDVLEVEAPDGVVRRYRVVETAVLDHRDTRPLAPSAGARLTLVTCWPFDAVRPGGPLRWVVVAEAVEASGRAAPELIARREGGSRRSGRGHP